MSWFLWCRCSCCGARCAPCRRCGCVAHRPLPLARVASSATGSAPLAPQTLTSGSSPTGTKINPIVNVSFTMGFIGAGGRTRTGTMSPSVDFESTTSTNSITPAGVLFFVLSILIPNALRFYQSPVAVPDECPCRWYGCVHRRPLPLALVASSATGGAPIAPHRTGRC